MRYLMKQLSRHFFYFKIYIRESEYIVIQIRIYENVSFTPIFVVWYEMASWITIFVLHYHIAIFGSGIESNHFCWFSFVLWSRVCPHPVLGWQHIRCCASGLHDASCMHDDFGVHGVSGVHGASRLGLCPSQ